jgi:hypothetical protein
MPAQSFSTAAQVAAGVIGSLCGGLLALRLGGAPTDGLIGGAVGAALPPLLLAWRRPLTGLLVFAVGVTVCYVSIAGYVLAKADPGKKPPPPPPTSGSTPSTGPTGHTVVDPPPRPSSPPPPSGGPGITVSTADLTCTDNGCDDITVTSSGGRALRIDTIEVDPPGHFRTSGCVGDVLSRGEYCRLAVEFVPGAATGEVTATLEINQNLPTKGPTRISLHADAGRPAIALSSDQVECLDLSDCGSVTVLSTGTAPLRIGSVDVVDRSTEIHADGCAHAVLAPGESCVLSVFMPPGDTTHGHLATVLINQNLPGGPTPIEVRG